MESKTSFLRGYNLYIGSGESWLPSESTILFEATNIKEFGRPYPELADSFKEYYFRGIPEVVEAHFNLPAHRGDYDTFYGASVIDNKVSRIKQYVYDSQTVGSDWDVVWLSQRKQYEEQTGTLL
jgi:hypothetical protein